MRSDQIVNSSTFRSRARERVDIHRLTAAATRFTIHHSPFTIHHSPFTTFLTAAATGLLLLLAAGARAQEAVREDVQFQKAFDGAVDRGLTYLAARQDTNGAWHHHTGITALGVMAFLARGNVPGCGAYGATIDRGIDFVLASQDDKGTLIGLGSGQMYSHNIATLMLAEVSGMVDPPRQKRLDAVLPRAIQVTLAAQKVPKNAAMQGGWRYGPNATDSDISHSGWAFMALRSARNSGAPVPREAIDDGLRFIRRCATADGGFAYQPGGVSGLARTGAALLCIELSGEHRSPVTLKAGKHIQTIYSRCWPGHEMRYYGAYYVAQGMHQLGEQEWETFAPAFYRDLLALQQADGAWRDMGAAEASAGPEYRTAMAILALSVSYRQLPIYQR